MRAVRFHEYGTTSVLTVVEVPDPEATAGRVVIRVKAAGINPGEIHIRDGSLEYLYPTTFPCGEGSDFAGKVVAVGAGVTGIAVGDEVLGYTHERGSHAELVAVPADQITAKPATLSWEVAGALFVAGTSAHALVDAVGVAAHDLVVVSAAAGGVGSLAGQWARLRGARVIGLAGPDNHAWLREHHIEPVDYHGDGLIDRIRAVGQPTAFIDTYGAHYPRLGVELGVKPTRVATVVASSDPESVGAQQVYHSDTADATMLGELARAAADGQLEVEIAKTFPLSEVRDAYDLLADGHTRGKIVLLP